MLNSVGPNGETPILDVVQDKNFELVKFLIPKLEKLDSRNEFGISVLHLAVANFDIFNEIYLNQLSKINPNLLDQNGRSALHWICNEEMVKNNDVSDEERFLIVMKLLTIMSNVVVDHKDITGKAPLQYAIQFRNAKIIKLLRKQQLGPKRKATREPKSKRFK